LLAARNASQESKQSQDKGNPELSSEAFELQIRAMTVPWYFGGSLKNADLYDFLVWKNEADRQGIKFKSDAIQDLIKQETRGHLTAKNTRQIEDALRKEYPNMAADELWAGLEDEFRVRLAKAAWD